MDVELIGLSLDRAGLDGFFGAWLLRGRCNAVVDVGPAGSAPGLIEALAAKGVRRVDYVLLTHIHLDHAGGLAEFLTAYPMARVICHETAVDHLADPSRLWSGSCQVLGGMAHVYGRPQPVPTGKLIPHDKNPLQEMQVVETPGHAPHHLSFFWDGRLFAGEAAGVYLNVGETDYLRPATPPRFRLDVCLESIARMAAFEDHEICYGHLGRSDSSHRQLERSRNQLKLWKEVIEEVLEDAPGNVLESCREALLRRDPNLWAYHGMTGERQQREASFMENSIKGFMGFLEKSV